MLALVLWGFECLRNINLCENAGPKTSLATGPRGSIGSLLSEGSPGLVVVATSSLQSGTEDEPPEASSTANLAEGCLASLLLDNFLWALNPIEAFAVTDLPTKSL